MFTKRWTFIILQWVDGEIAMSMWVKPEFRAAARQIEQIVPYVLTGALTAMALIAMLSRP